MVRDSSKPKGKVSAYAYYVKQCNAEIKAANPNQTINFAEFSKKCSDDWKKLNPHQKAHFEQLALNDKMRYDNEMKHYNAHPSNNDDGVVRKRKKLKDPNAPKRALSAFFFFSNDQRPQIKMVHPEWAVSEVAKELGALWNKLPPNERSKYDKMAQKDKERYAQDMIVYRS